MATNEYEEYTGEEFPIGTFATKNNTQPQYEEYTGEEFPIGTFASKNNTQPKYEEYTGEEFPTGTFASKKEKPGFLRETVGDFGVGVAKGFVGLGEAAVGLLDIPTMGYAGKYAEKAQQALFGGTTQDLQEYLQTLKTPDQIEQENKVAQTKGFVGTLGALIKNPGALSNLIAETIPSMLGGAGVARYAIAKGVPFISGKAGQGANYIRAAALGEGTVAAGQQAEQIRQQTEQGLLTPGQSTIALGSGVLTGMFGILGGKAAKYVGLDDVDVLLAGKKAGKEVSKEASKKTQNALVAAFKAGIAESAFEELPQSVQEQIAQNIALDKPWDEGVAESAAQGAIAGFAVAGGITGPKTALDNLKTRQEQKKKDLDRKIINKQIEDVSEDEGDGEGEEGDGDLSRQQVQAQELKNIMEEGDSIIAQKETKASQNIIDELPTVDVSPTLLTSEKLATLEINKNSLAYKKSLGLDLSKPEDASLFNSLLDNYKGKINEPAAEALLSIATPLEIQDEAGIDSTTTGVSDEVSQRPDDGLTGTTDRPVAGGVVGGPSTTGIAGTGTQPSAVSTLTAGYTAEQIDAFKKAGFEPVETTQPDGTVTTALQRIAVPTAVAPTVTPEVAPTNTPVEEANKRIAAGVPFTDITQLPDNIPEPKVTTSTIEDQVNEFITKRKGKGVTRSDLAKHLGVSPAQVGPMFANAEASGLYDVVTDSSNIKRLAPKKEGTEQVYYRGTPEKFDNVAGTGGVIYFSPNREEAKIVGGSIVAPYRLKVKNTFDINNKAHLKKVLAELSNEKPTFFKGRSYKNSQREIFKQALEDNPNFNFAPYEIIEEFAEEIEGAGFDSFFVKEQAGYAMGAKNIGVFDSSLIEPVQEAAAAVETVPETKPVVLEPDQLEFKKLVSELRRLDPETARQIGTININQVTPSDLQDIKQLVKNLKIKSAVVKESEYDIKKELKDIVAEVNKEEAEREADSDINTDELFSIDTQTPAEKDAIAFTVNSGTLSTALKRIRDAFKDYLSPSALELMNKILATPNINTTLYSVRELNKPNERMMRPIKGMFSRGNNSILIDPNASIQTILHEGVHAATAAKIKQELKKNTALGKRLLQLFNEAQQSDTNNQFTIKGVDEFIAEALTNPSYQTFLAGVPSPTNEQSLWSNFVNFVKDLLQLDISNTLLNDVLVVAPELFQGPRKNIVGRPESGREEDTLFSKPIESPKKLEKDLDALAVASGATFTPASESTAFNSRDDDPSVQAAKKRKGWRRYLDAFETQFFSFDAALSNQIRRGLEALNVGWEETRKILHSISISQSLHDDSVAHQFLEDGGIAYNKELFRFETKKVKNSWKGIMDKLQKLADKEGIPFEKIEQYAHIVFVANRLEGLNKSNAELKQKVLKLYVAGKKDKAKTEWDNNFKFVHLTNAQIEESKKIIEKLPQLKNIMKEWNEVRLTVLNFAREAGLYSEEQVSVLEDIMDYVPFFREDQIQKGDGPQDFARGLFMEGEKKLQGSKQPVNNVFDNMERWITYTIKSGIRNRAAINLKNAAMTYLDGEVIEVENPKLYKRENTISITENTMVDGKEVRSIRHYVFEDPLYIKAFTGMESLTINSIPYLTPMANFFRDNIILYPVFSMSQVVQDAYSAMFSSGVQNPFGIPIEVIKEIIRTSLGTSKTRQALKRVGAVGSTNYMSVSAREDAAIVAGLKQPRLRDKLLKPFRMLSAASDNVIRQAIYNQTIKETGDKALAIERAFEVINFRRAGSNRFTNAAKHVVPFFGAYLQALNVMYKVFSGRGIAPNQKGEAARILRNTMIKTAILSLAYSALVAGSDDDDYQATDPAVRDRRLIIPGMGASLPLRTDLFTFFSKVFPEHMYNRLTDNEDGTKMKKAMGEFLVNSLLSPTVYPQAISPLYNAARNYDPFTGRAIVGQGLEGLDTERQFTGRTSQLAKMLGETGLISPAKADYILNGYFGYTSGAIIAITNPLLADLRGDILPTKDIRESARLVPGSAAFILSRPGTRAKNDYYEFRDIVDTAYNTYKNLLAYEEDTTARQKYINENKTLIAMKTVTDNLGAYLGQLRKEENRILSTKRMTPDEKKATLDRLKRKEIEALDHFRENNPEMGRYIQSLRKQSGL